MSPATKAVLLGGFVAGTIDLGSASLINSASPVLICHYIAIGVLGRASLSDGAWAAWLGLFLQWGMALIIAAIYCAVTARIPTLRRQWLLGGAIGGAVTFFVMDWVVLPLSRVGHPPRFTLRGAVENFIAIIVFGEIIAFFARQQPAAKDNL